MNVFVQNKFEQMCLICRPNLKVSEANFTQNFLPTFVELQCKHFAPSTVLKRQGVFMGKIVMA
jgi:hypothetical protein